MISHISLQKLKLRFFIMKKPLESLSTQHPLQDQNLSKRTGIV